MSGLYLLRQLLQFQHLNLQLVTVELSCLPVAEADPAVKALIIWKMYKIQDTDMYTFFEISIGSSGLQLP